MSESEHLLGEMLRHRQVIVEEADNSAIVVTGSTNSRKMSQGLEYRGLFRSVNSPITHFPVPYLADA